MLEIEALQVCASRFRFKVFRGPGWREVGEGAKLHGLGIETRLRRAQGVGLWVGAVGGLGRVCGLWGSKLQWLKAMTCMSGLSWAANAGCKLLWKALGIWIVYGRERCACYSQLLAVNSKPFVLLLRL